jgi:hypothetical protein
MDAHQKELGAACVWLSLLAHARSVEDCLWLKKQQWGPVKLNDICGVVQQYARHANTKVTVWNMVDTDKVLSFGTSFKVKPNKIGPLTRNVHVVVVPMGWGFHMLPIQDPILTAKVPTTHITGVSLAGANLATSSSSVAPPTPVVTATPPVNAAVPGLTPIGPETVIKVVAVEAAEPEKPLVYDGIHAPPACCTWRRGWWPSTGIHVASLETELPMLRPDVASATKEYALSYLDLVYYLPVEAQRPLYMVDRRTVTDGRNRTQCFMAGDVVEAGNSSYVARPVKHRGVDMLRLICTNASLLNRFQRSLRDLIPFVNSAAEVTLATSGEVDVEEEAKQAAMWSIVLNTTKDPVSVAALNRFRNSAASQGYGKGAVKAVDARDWVKQTRQMFPDVDGVGGRFQWGYCYSCGKELPGTFKNRMCKDCGQRKNSILGRMVAEGSQVGSPAMPVVYPGVVNTVTRHPPLKVVESFATDQNFRLAPSALRGSSPSPPLRDAVRA